MRDRQSALVLTSPEGKPVPHDCGGILCDESACDGGTLRCATCDGDRSPELSPEDRQDLIERAAE